MDEVDLKKLSDVIYTILEDEASPRHPRSNETRTMVPPGQEEDPYEAGVLSSTVFNYWLSHEVSTEASTERAASKTAGGNRTRLEELRDEIGYRTLVKRTNSEFLAFLDQAIREKGAELEDEERRVNEGYGELNRTREALFAAFGKRGRLSELRRRVKQREAQLEEMERRVARAKAEAGEVFPWGDGRVAYAAASPYDVVRKAAPVVRQPMPAPYRHPGQASYLMYSKQDPRFKTKYWANPRLPVYSEALPAEYPEQKPAAVSEHRRAKRCTRLGTPWVRIQFPDSGLRAEELQDPLPEAPTTMSVGQLVWTALRKFLPFQKADESPEGSIPLKVHYRIGKDVAHIAIHVPGDTTPAPRGVRYPQGNT